MKNKVLMLLMLFMLIGVLMFTTGCSDNNVTNGNGSTKTEENDKSINLEIDKDQTIEELKTSLLAEVENKISMLESEWDSLKNEINTYEKYVKNVDNVEDFYKKIETTTEEISIRLYEYSFIYAEKMLSSKKSHYDIYDDLKDIHDDIYEDARDEIHDRIYEDLLEDMEDTFYNGIIKDAEDDEEYSDWYDIRSDEYSMWYDTRSEVYEIYYDAGSDIYGFYYDLTSDVYADDMADANDTLNDFKEDIEDMKK